MPSLLYPIPKKVILDAGLNFLTANMKVALVNAVTSPYNAAHDFVNDISAGIVVRSGNLAGKTTTNGTFDANDFTIAAVTGTITAMVLYRDTGVDATSDLVAWFDLVPFVGTGGTVTVTLNTSGLFAI